MKYTIFKFKNLLLASIFFIVSIASAICQNNLPKGTVERIKVHGKALEGNLSGDSPDRDVSVFLPPSYKKDTKRRYPVVYFLHGFTDNDAKFYGFQSHWMNMPDAVSKAYANGNVKEVIIVTPNAFTRFQGSMYSNSVTTGNWEEYIAKELVAYIDSHYRTIPQAASRGLSGHSMGGYGTMRIGEKYPDVFSSIYLLSPCCLAPWPDMGKSTEAQARLDAVKTPEDIAKADFMTKIALASAAAWSPNPKNPPLYLDLPLLNGEVQPSILSKWTANQPLTTIDQYIYNLKKLNGIAFDAGNKDESIAANIKVLDQILNSYELQHFYEEYEGDHLNKVAERIEKKMLPFFSQHLSFEQKVKK